MDSAVKWQQIARISKPCLSGDTPGRSVFEKDHVVYCSGEQSFAVQVLPVKDSVAY